MKKQYNGKKIRYGSSAAILTAAVIAAVILLNVFVTALSNISPWMFLDMTAESIYTVSDECFDLLREEAITKVDEAREYNKQYNENGGIPASDSTAPLSADSGESAETDAEAFVPRDENISINIYFLDDRDVMDESEKMHYIHRTALDLASEFPDHIKIKYIDIDKNPSAVRKFLTTDTSTIDTDDIVVEFGTEFRVISYVRFYVVDSSTNDVLGYDGEKQFASAILAITRAQSPICLVDMAHGEAFYDPQLLYTLEDAGYQIAKTEEYLTEEVIAEAEEEYDGDVRLILIYNPTSDFMVASRDSSGNVISDIDEIDTLDKFLDGKSSLMVFMSPTSPVLPNLEEYLEEWGISFDRETDGDATSSYLIKDDANSLTSNGLSPVAEYVTTGLGGQITTDMRNVSYPKKLIFKNAMSISYSSTYTETTYDPADNDNASEDAVPYTYGKYYSNGVSREIYDLFVTSDSAVAMANGKIVEDDETAVAPFRLMTVSCEMRVTQEDPLGISQIQENSYVIACGSTEFASEGLLQSAVYGNTDFLLSALTVIGREPVPVGIVYTPFADQTIDSLTTSAATVWTVCLTVIPAVVALVTGVVILVKRKYA